MRLKYKLPLIASFCTLVATMPSCLSTKLGSRALSQVLSQVCGYKINLEGNFTYFKAQQIHHLSILFPKALFEADKLEIKNIGGLFLGQKGAIVNLEDFQLSLIDSLSKNSLQAGFTLNLPKNSIPIQCELTFKNGSIFSKDSQSSLTNIQGRLDYFNQKVSQFHVSANSAGAGVFESEGKIDFQTQNIEAFSTFKNVSNKIIPNAFISGLIGDNFDAQLGYIGSLQSGKFDYLIKSSNFSLKGQASNQNQMLMISEPTHLRLESLKNLNFGEFEATCLKGEIILRTLAVDIHDPLKMRDLDLDINLFASSILTKTGSLENLSVFSHFHDENEKVLGAFTLSLKDKLILKASSEGSKGSNLFETIDLCIEKMPTSFLGLDTNLVGNDVSLNAHANLSSNVAHISLDASSDCFQNIKGNLMLKSEELICDRIDFDYKSDICMSGVIKNSKVSFSDLSKTALNTTFVVHSIKDVPQFLFPLNISLDSKNLSMMNLEACSDELAFKGQIQYQDGFRLKEDIIGSLILNPDQFKLKEKATVGFKIQKHSSFNKLMLDFESSPFVLDDVYSLNHLQGKMTFKGDEKKWHLKTSAKFDGKKETQGFIDFDGHFQNLNPSYGYLKFQNIPFSSLSLVSPEIEKFSKFFGKDAKGEILFEKSDEGTKFDTKIQSENLKISGAFVYDHNLRLIKPASAKWTIRSLDIPFSSLSFPFELKKPVDIDCAVSKLEMHKFGDKLLFEIDADLQLNGLSLCQNLQNIQLDCFKLSLKKAKDDPSLNLTSSGDLYSLAGKTLTAGNLEASCKILNFDDFFLNSSLEPINLEALIKLENFPTLFLDFFQKDAKFPFSSTFGETLDAHIDINHKKDTGYLKSLITGKDSLIKINAQKENGLYKLTDDLLIQTRMSPELSRLFFYKKPMGVEQFSSKYPIVVKATAKGSQFTMFPFELTKLRLPECIFDFGRVSLNSSHLLPQALNLIKNTPNSKTLSVWFQPIKTSVQNGIMHIPRFDFLVLDQFHMCLFGDIDLKQDQVGMILGITSNCLNKALKMTELAPEYVLQVPVFGKLDDVKIDAKKAAKKVASLIALQKGGSLFEKIGSTPMEAIANFLKDPSKLPDAEKQTPKANGPFPWEKQVKPKQKNEPKKKAIRSSDSPLKQILKMFF